MKKEKIINRIMIFLILVLIFVVLIWRPFHRDILYFQVNKVPLLITLEGVQKNWGIKKEDITYQINSPPVCTIGNGRNRIRFAPYMKRMFMFDLSTEIPCSSDEFRRELKLLKAEYGDPRVKADKFIWSSWTHSWRITLKHKEADELLLCHIYNPSIDPSIH